MIKPEIKKLKKPIAKRTSGVKLILFFRNLLRRLNKKMKTGTAMIKTTNTKAKPGKGFSPITNI
jgi:hypothetical protein